MRDTRHDGEKRSKIGGWPLATGIAVLLVFLFFVRHILTPFVFAAALAFILTPPIDWLQGRLRIPRWIVAATVYAVILAIVITPAVIYGRTMMHDLSQIGSHLPQLVHQYVADFARIVDRVFGLNVNVDKVSAVILDRGAAFLKSGAAITVAGYGTGAIFGVILGLVVLAYFLISGKRIAAGVFWLVPPEYRREVDAVAAKILPLLWRYFFGLMVVVIYTTTLAWIAFGPIFHVSHAPVLALVVGLLELIPLIGPATTLVIVGIISSQQSDIVSTIGLFGFAIALRLSLDELVAPLVLGHAARLHPAVIIFAFLSGGALFGVLGLLLAVPVAASIKIVLSIYYAEPIAKQPEPVPAPRRKAG